MAIKENHSAHKEESANCLPLVRRGLSSAEMEQLKQKIIAPAHSPNDEAREALRNYQRIMAEMAEK